MSLYVEQIRTAIAAIAVHLPTGFSWFGVRSHPLPRTLRRTLDPQTVRSYVLHELQGRLYRDFYCKGGAVPGTPEAEGGRRAAADLADCLSAANNGDGFWESGWRVHTRRAVGVMVGKAGLQLVIRPEECVADGGGGLHSGMTVRVWMPKEHIGISPGFYMAVSNAEWVASEAETVVRCYWNVTPEGGIRLMRNLTEVLNRESIPFRLKVLSDTSHYGRCDAGVLYLRRADYLNITTMLEQVYEEVRSNVRPRTPVFAKRLVDGLGLAEDPPSPQSFGQQRCTLLADGIIRAYERRRTSPNECLASVLDRFAEDGVRPDKPFLNAGSVDDYTKFRCGRRVCGRDVTGDRPLAASNTWLRTAEGIGEQLAREAIWDGAECTWLGPVDQYAGLNLRTPVSYSPLGPELYSGTSGVALFLAELNRVNGGSLARRTALGAIRHALGAAERIPSGSRNALFTGWVGIALAAAYVGCALGEDDLLDDAAGLLRRNEEEYTADCEFDLLTGKAGSVAGLLTLAEILPDSSALEFAIRIGDNLLEAADHTTPGLSWKTKGFATHQNLTGFSHGAAGSGYALLELFYATLDSRYREAAISAFEYERHCFDSREKNWPDFRSFGGPQHGVVARPSFGGHWCHGAPGIALSRLRAYSLLGDPLLMEEATVAVQTTCRKVREAMQSGFVNYSLCHGLAGNAETLVYAAEVLPESAQSGRLLAEHVAQTGVEAYASRSIPWPCGTSSGECPGLMLGLAGIGHFYLRLHEPAIPSWLILLRQKIARSVPRTGAQLHTSYARSAK